MIATAYSDASEYSLAAMAAGTMARQAKQDLAKTEQAAQLLTKRGLTERTLTVRALSEPASPAGGTPTPRYRILAAALHCFAAKGFHGTSMQEVCTQADMSPGALYRHFPSKDAIIAAIAEQERENNRKFFQKLDVTENILETLMDTGFAWMRDLNAREGAALCVEVLAEAHRNPRIREIFERNHVEARGALPGTLFCISQKFAIALAMSVRLLASDGLVRKAFAPSR